VLPARDLGPRTPLHELHVRRFRDHRDGEHGEREVNESDTVKAHVEG
jgi:hypothetical protein